MPNWCFNEVRVTADTEEELKEFVLFVEDIERDEQGFNNYASSFWSGAAADDWKTINTTEQMRTYPYRYQMLIPSGLVIITVLSLNFLGDWARDKLDPKLREFE